MTPVRPNIDATSSPVPNMSKILSKLRYMTTLLLHRSDCNHMMASSEWSKVEDKLREQWADIDSLVVDVGDNLRNNEVIRARQGDKTSPIRLIK